MNPAIDPVEQFFSMFARANAAVWPMELVWYAAAIAAVVLAFRPVRTSSQLSAGFLAVYYVWLGIVFFGVFYSPINDHALAVGAMFVLGGALWLIAGVVRQELQFQARWDLLGAIGGAFVLYGLAVHPVIGMFGSHFFPAAPVFGLAPCPSAIFTVGLLLWTRRRVPMYVVVVPLVWLLAQTPAEALALGVVADVGRPIVGIVGTALLVWRDYRALRERLFAGGVLGVAILCLGKDDLLMGLGLVFLVGTFVRWFVRRPRRNQPQRRAPSGRRDGAGASRTRASTTSAPLALTITGLQSISAMCG